MASLEIAPKEQLTIELSEQLVKQLNRFLAEHPDESLEALLRDALYVRQAPKDPDKFLQSAGFLKNVPSDASEHPEDSVS